MTIANTTRHVGALSLTADLDLTDPAKATQRHNRVMPADLRTVVGRDEIRAADARYVAKLEAACNEVQINAWFRFEQGAITLDDYRATVRSAKAELQRRLP